MAGDALYSSVGLLLHGDGANGGTIITDNSASPKTPTNTSVTTSTAQSLFGGSSLAFGATGHRLVYAHNTAFQPTSDFCVECAVRVPAVTGAIRVIVWKGTSTGQYPYYIYIDANGKVQANSYGTSGLLVSLLSTASIAANAFTRIAFDRNGSNFRLFIDGALAASGTASGAVYSNTADPLVIGNTSDGAYGLGSGGTAYIDEFRVTMASRRTAAYTPDADAFPNSAVGYALSGVTRDSSNALAARLVRAYREDTGAFVGSATSNATTGAYSIPTDVNTAHTLNAYPASGESLPVLSLSGVIPL